jgi:hypothetical protein
MSSAELKLISPSQSIRVAFGSRDSRSLAMVSAIAAAPTGTFTKNTQRQPSPVVIAPPTSGPMATEMPIVAP